MEKISKFAAVSIALAVSAAAFLCVSPGCGYQSNRSRHGETTAGRQTDFRRELFQNALLVLTAPEQYPNEKQAGAQLVERLTQWARAVRESASPGVDPSGWTRDPLIDTLPEKLRDTRWFRNLGGDTFDPQYDAEFLSEAALMRDVATTVRGAEPSDLSLAEALFDWTVRNIQVESDNAESPAEQNMALHLPGETLFYGNGTPLQRAWVFMLLARQAGLDVVLLATDSSTKPGELRPWATAFVGNGELYLFDYTYGLPIPGPGGKGVATLAQAASDESILRQMDVPGGRVYPKSARNVENVTALIEATPGFLNRRMKLVESQLTGRQRIVLSFSPSALAERLNGIAHVKKIELWPKPLETLFARQSPAPAVVRAGILEEMPFSLDAKLPTESGESAQSQQDARKRAHRIYPLRTGRLLHLRGDYAESTQLTGNRAERQHSTIAQRGAKFYYLLAIPDQRDLQQMAVILRRQNQSSGQRPFDEQLLMAVDRAEPWNEVLVSTYPTEWAAAMKQMRDDAVYWMGLLCYDDEDYQTAVQYLGPMLLDDEADEAWTAGARFNLARCCEKLGQIDRAIELYRADRSPQRYGNLLRASRLAAKPEAE